MMARILTMIPGFGRSEVIILYPDLFNHGFSNRFSYQQNVLLDSWMHSFHKEIASNSTMQIHFLGASQSSHGPSLLQMFHVQKTSFSAAATLLAPSARIRSPESGAANHQDLQIWRSWWHQGMFID